MKKRQKFSSETDYKNFLREHDEVIDFLKTNTFESDSPEEEAALRSRHLQKLALDRLLAAYTAGEEITSLPPLLSNLIDKYETRQAKLATFEKTHEISPLAIDDWPYLYEECVQVIGSVYYCIVPTFLSAL